MFAPVVNRTEARALFSRQGGDNVRRQLAYSNKSQRCGRERVGLGGAVTSRAGLEALRETDCFAGGQSGCRLLKIVPGGGFGSVNAWPPFHHVEIHFHDLLFAPAISISIVK
jgi:hypothetical protein